MANLARCGCGGFLPASGGTSACPHCGRAAATGALRGLVRTVACIAAGGAVSVTLMACYGPPVVDRSPTATPPTPTTSPSSSPTPAPSTTP